MATPENDVARQQQPIFSLVATFRAPFRNTFVRVSAYETNRSGSLNKPVLTLSFCSGNAGLDISSCRKILIFDGGRWRNQTISVEISGFVGFVKVAIQISRPGRQESKRLGDGPHVLATNQQFIASMAAGILCAAPFVSVADPGDPPTSRSDPGESSERALAPGVWTSPDGATVTYEASFFEPYTTVSAADMLRWVPGGAAPLPATRRRRHPPRVG